ncbi:MAG: hypothetical protein ACOC0Q_01405 [Wenzhouxiangella sp.]
MPARLLKLATPKAVYVGLTAIGLLLGLLGTAGWALFEAHQIIGSGEVALKQCLEDNKHQTRQLRETRDELGRLVAELAVDRDALADSLLASERAARQREQDQAAERQARAQIYSEVPECEEWREAAPCAEIAERLIRSRADLIRRLSEEDP